MMRPRLNLLTLSGVLCGLSLTMGMHSASLASEDSLANNWTGDASYVEEKIQEAAALPGGEKARQWGEGPVLVWVDRVFLGTDNAYTSDETRYCVVRVLVANRGEKELQLKKENITLHAGVQNLTIEGGAGKLRDIPLKIDWHAERDLRPRSQLRTPKTVKVLPGRTTAFWAVFAGLDSIPPIPMVTLDLAFESGPMIKFDLSAQQNVRLGLTATRMGPRNVLGVLTIHGQLNRVNSLMLVQQMAAFADARTSRFIVAWGPKAQPSDEGLFSWLWSPNFPNREANPLHMQLPMLPQLRQLLLVNLPSGNEGVDEWDGTHSIVFPHGQDAALYALKDIYERIDPKVTLEEIRNGHPWSRYAALKSAGGRIGPQALPDLLGLTKSPDVDLRNAAILALGRQPVPAAEQRLNDLLQETDVASVTAALSSLLSNATTAHRVIVRQFLEQESLPLARAQIVELLAENYHPDWNSYLSRSVVDADANVRKVTLAVLHRVGHPELDHLCKTALSDPDELVREQAFQILVDNRGRDAELAARDYALKRLSEGHIDDSILGFVARIRETRAAPALLVEIRRSSSSRGRLIEVIGEIGTDEHLQAVLAGLEKYSEEDRLIALQLLNRLSVDSQLETARRMSHSKLVGVRRALLDLLGAIGNDAAVSILHEMLHDEDSAGMVGAICSTMGTIGTQEAVASLRHFRAQSVSRGQVENIKAADRGLKEWRARLPGFNFVESAYMQRDQEAEAIKAFTIAISINPQLSDAYSGRGNLYLRKGEFANAREDFLKAVQLDGDDGQSVTGVAITTAILGEVDKAVAMAEENAKRFPNDPFYSYNSACVFARCVETLKKTEQSAERDARIERYEKQAIGKLKESIKFGFRDFAWMQKDPDLASLQELAEFKDLKADE